MAGTPPGIIGVHGVAAVSRAARPHAPWTLLFCCGVPALLIGLLGWSTFVTGLVMVIDGVFIWFFVRHLGFAVVALRGDRNDHEPLIETDGELPSVSVVVACKNEAAVIDRLLSSLRALDYPREQLQIVIVDDGSTDGTPHAIAAIAHADPVIELLRRPEGAPGGKSGALNAALAQVRGEIVVVFDADHVPRRDVLRRLVRHFRDPNVGAAQGRCVIRNGGDSLLARLVAVDYLAGYLVNEYGRQALHQLPAYGGANCAVRTSSLRALGGWNERSVTEDTDLTMRLILRGERIRYDVTAIDEEEGVVTLRRFWRQRYRWARGHQDVWRDYRRDVFASSRLSLREKFETAMFLLVYHVPIFSALGLVVLGLWVAGLARPVDPIGVHLLWTLLFLGPLLELAAGLLVARTARREAAVLLYFLPVFVLSMVLCTKAWVDGLAGRRYSWVKTKRSGDRDASRASADLDLAGAVP